MKVGMPAKRGSTKPEMGRKSESIACIEASLDRMSEL
jgi:hypothetical protein